MYEAVLAMTEAIKRKLYHELGFESSAKRRWYRKLYYFYKVFKTRQLRYLFDVTPTAKRAYITKNDDKRRNFKVKHTYFKILSSLRL